MSALIWIAGGVGWLIITTVVYVTLEAGDLRAHVRKGDDEQYKVQPGYWFLCLLWPFAILFFIPDGLEWMVHRAARIERMPEYQERKTKELERTVL